MTGRASVATALAMATIEEFSVSAEIDRLRAALSFYADPKNWERRVTKESAPYCLSPAVESDLGRTARSALKLPEPTNPLDEIPFG